MQHEERLEAFDRHCVWGTRAARDCGKAKEFGLKANVIGDISLVVLLRR
jgi:hypothetical protein